MKTQKLRSAVLLVLAAPLVAAACGTKTSTGGPAPIQASASASASASAGPPVVKGPDYTENDFVESDHNRDPFRSFALANQAASKPVLNQRKVSLGDYSVDELKLIAIITGGEEARAMFLDPTGKGTVVYPGTFLCRPEVVHMGGSNGPEYQLNWRVERIREGDVVLVREDPAQPGIPPATRVIPLHPDTEKQPVAPL